MANIGSMPSGADLLTGDEVAGEYGDHLRWVRDGEDKVHLYTKSEGLVIVAGDVLIATASIHAAYVYTERLEPLIVPYVNAFIGFTNQRVEKYWRTKEYRVLPFERAVTGSARVNTQAAEALRQIAPRVQSDAEKAREKANFWNRIAAVLEAEEARELEAERQKLKESAST